MKGEIIKIDAFIQPNTLITIAGRDMGAVAANEIQAVLDFSSKEAQELMYVYRQQGRYVPLIADESKIKSLVIMKGLTVYPSTFRVQTLISRIQEATDRTGFLENQP